MPVADFDDEPQKFDLVTCPDGEVWLRQMPYGQRLTRQDIIMDISVQMAAPGRGNSSQAGVMDVKSQNRATTEFDFRNCIVRHNLTHRDDRPYDFKNPLDWQGKLNPKVGAEIDALISELNGFNEDATADFTPRSTDGHMPQTDSTLN